MAIIVKPNIFVPGTVIRSAEVNDDFDTTYNDYNGNIRDVNIHLSSAKILVGNASDQAVERTMTGDGTLSNTGVFTLNSGSVAAFTFLPPIGTIIAFYDFAGALTFDATKWAYCNGQSIAVGSIGLQTLPDLSNRYLVGFGVEGTGDIGTVLFQTPAVGEGSGVNAHTINIQHSHTVDSHFHTLGSHTHTTDAHTHAITGATQQIETTGSRDLTTGAGILDVNGPGSADEEGDHSHPISLTSGSTVVTVNSTSLPNTGSFAPGTDSQLSTTQSIQPRSIRTRFLMRIA